MGEVGRDVLYLTDTYVGYKVSQSVGAVKVTLQLVFYDEYRRGLTLKTTRFCFQRSKLGRFKVEKPCTP